MASANLRDQVPAADHPGWYDWRPDETERFNALCLGRLLVRREGERTTRLRLATLEKRHTNPMEGLHAAVIMGLADISMFATLFAVSGPAMLGAVTVDLTHQFLGIGRTGDPLEAVCEILKETRRLAFLRGTVEQRGHVIASFIGTVRKPSTP